jgi:hypothetical protein
MANVRAGFLAVALVAAIGVGWAGTHRPAPTPKFCTAEGLVSPESGHQYHKNDDCQWVDEDGNLLVDTDGRPVDVNTPPEKLPWN